MPSPSPSSTKSNSKPAVDTPAAWAAVSYVFEDALWCDWLFGEFDGLRVPKVLIHRPSRHGLPYPDRISMTPDPSDPEQLDGYLDALRKAQHLILVISPSSGHSELLGEHLRVFRSISDGERIIAIIVNGDPGYPNAEPASENDKEWLPPYLQWRFDGKKFAEADSTEPLVIDARLGVSTLAEVRARLLAAMLEVEEERLFELGAVPRYNIRPVIWPSASATAPLEKAAEISAAPEAKPRKSGSVWVAMAVAVCAVIGGMAVWWLPLGDADEALSASRGALPLPNSEVRTPVKDDGPLVVVKAAPFLATPIPAAAPQKPVETSKPPAAPAPGISAATALTPDTNTREFRSMIERRDRFFFLGEARLRSGDGEEAYDIFKQAAEVAAIINRRSEAEPEHLLRAAEIHRRIGQLAAKYTTPVEGREHLEKARNLIHQIRTKSTVGPDGAKLLLDVESALKNLSSR
jgi:hypothetical protein